MPDALSPPLQVKNSPVGTLTCSCSRTKNVSKRWTALTALSSSTQADNTPVSEDQTHLKVRLRFDPRNGHQMAVSRTTLRYRRDLRCRRFDGLNLRFPEEAGDHHLDGLRVVPGTVVEHNDDVFCYCRIVPGRNVHREDVHVGLASASTLCRGRRGGVRDETNERCCTFVRKHPGELDVLKSSSNPQNKRS